MLFTPTSMLKPLCALCLVTGLLTVLSGCRQDSSKLNPVLAQPNPQAQAEALQEQQQKQTEEAAEDLGATPTEPTVDAAEQLVVRTLDAQWSDANMLVELNAEVDVPQGQSLERVLWTQIAGDAAVLLTPERQNTQVLVPNVAQLERLSFRLAVVDTKWTLVVT